MARYRWGKTKGYQNLAAALTKRAPGYTSLGFPDPRRTV